MRATVTGGAARALPGPPGDTGARTGAAEVSGALPSAAPAS
ncbi:hypothetical protein ACF1AE_00310 [Streptomyces sp. NPDC014986]